jgi:hypothetical protein
MTHPYAELDGAYVLGALSPVERLDYERHLATCEECSRSVRDLAGMPGLLSRVDATVLEDPSDAAESESVPEALLTNLVREVRRDRRRRRLLTAGLAAAVILAVGGLTTGVVTGAFGHDRTPAAAAAAHARTMTPVGDAPVRATLALEPVTWGTRLELACTYRSDAGWDGPHAPTYTLYVHTRDGRTEAVGTWRSVEGRTMRVAATTAAQRSDIVSVEVRTASGRPVLELPG